MNLTSIRAKLIAATVGAVCAAMLALTLANLWIARRAADAAMQDRLLSLSEVNARLLGDWVSAKSQVVQALVPAAAEPEPVAALVLAKQAGGYDTTYIGWADKRIVFSSPQDLPAGYDPTARPWYQQAVAERKPVLTSPYADAATKRLVVTFATPVVDGSAVKAVAAGDVFIDSVVESVRAIKPSPNSLAYLVDAAGLVIAHPDAGLTLKPAEQAVKGMDAAALKALRDSRQREEAQIGSDSFWLSARQVPGTDWTLVIAMHRGDALGALAAMRTTAGLTALVALVLASALVAALTAVMLKRLGQLRDALQDIATGDGDLTRRLDASSSDELGQVARAFNLFVDKLAGTLRSIQMTTESVNTAASEIAAGNQDLSARTESAASSLQETASAMDQLTGAVRQTADSAGTANQLALSAADAATRGGSVVTQVVSTMHEINDSSRRIHDIIGVIDGIAFQTNILALNAAVEAARAGEQGRGFAVVAGEVRALAQRSAEAAKEIKALIGTSVGKAEDGARLVQEAGQVMGEIVDSVKRVSDIIGEISAAAQEQSAGIGQVGTAVSQLDQMTQQNAALVEESAAAALSLREQANTLASAVSAFRLSH